jgi:hypothetical protein
MHFISHTPTVPKGIINKEQMLAWLEKQGEKPTEKVEPKFHEGEWITNGDYIWKIVMIKSLDYILQSQGGNIVEDTISHVDEQFHSFTIEDAQDGDVLVNGDEIVIFKKNSFNEKDLSGSMFVHCSLRNKRGYWYTIGGINPSNYVPATKEQRELLFQKMKESGYEWDVEKKELKKVEPLTDFEKAFQGMCCDKNKQFAKECCKTLLELAKKQLQSKRNEFELDEISYKIGVNRVLENPESYGLTKNRLKPSTSDIMALEDIMNGHGNTAAYLVLQSIIEQLKNT